MFDFSFGEMLLTAVVALLVVGPKELPALLRQWGRFAGAARRQWHGIMQELEENVPPPNKILGDDGKWYAAYDMDDLQRLNAPQPVENPGKPVEKQAETPTEQ